jgi:hypothetical protein
VRTDGLLLGGVLDRLGASSRTVDLPQIAEELAQWAVVGKSPSDSLRGGEIATTETSVRLDDTFSLAPNSPAPSTYFR